jgi:hypothetical protein
MADSAGSPVRRYTSKEQIDTFIQQAEHRGFITRFSFQSIRKNVTGPVTTSNNKYLSPVKSDFLAVYSMAVIDGDGNYEYLLLNKDVNFIRAIYPKPNGNWHSYSITPSLVPTTTNTDPSGDYK